MDTESINIVVLSRGLGEGGAGISALDYLLKFDEIGAKTLAIYQTGTIPDSYDGNAIKLRDKKYTARFEKLVFRRYPHNPSRELISAGLGFANQRRILSEIRKYAARNKKTIVNVHWSNLGFLSLRTLYRLTTKENLRIMLHIHDLWFFQDLFHTPSNFALGERSKIFTWSLEGRPNILQKYLMKRSRNYKKKILENSLLVSPTEELKEYLKTNYSRSTSNAIQDSGIIIIGQPMLSMSQYIEKSYENTRVVETPRPTFLIPGGHNFDDVRMNYELALNSFIKSEVGQFVNLKVISGTPIHADIFKKYSGSSISFGSSLDHKSFLTELAVADAVICPSLFETFGLTIAESCCISRLVGVQSNTLQAKFFSNTISHLYIGDWSIPNTWVDFYSHFMKMKALNSTCNKETARLALAHIQVNENELIEILARVSNR